MKMQIKSIASALAFTCAIMLSLNSCSKFAKNLQYDLNMQTASVDIVIPAYSDTSISVSGSQTVYFNVDSFIRANTANVMGLSNIQSVKIKSCVFILMAITARLVFLSQTTRILMLKR
jgi:hypothetical protein